MTTQDDADYKAALGTVEHTVDLLSRYGKDSLQELMERCDALSAEVVALREALRLHCIRDSFDTHAKRCTNCGSAWDGGVERHVAGCLAEKDKGG